MWIRNIHTDTPEHAAACAREVANQVLDAAALYLGQAHEILPIPIRIESESKTLVMSGSAARVEVTGTPPCPSSVVPVDLDAATFFRRALVAERRGSWFEAFREYYRALEWLTTEATGSWSKRDLTCLIEKALGDHELRMEVEKRARHLVADLPLNPPLDELAPKLADHLRGVRNALDHAKRLKDCTYIPPYDTEAEDQVRKDVDLARATSRAAIAWFLRQKNP